MKVPIEISPRAKLDLELILQYVYLENPDISKKLAAAFYATIGLICDFPHLAPLYLPTH